MPRASSSRRRQSLSGGAGQVALSTSFFTALALVFIATGTVLSGEPERAVERGRVLARLDEFTRSGESGFDAIRAFLRLPGMLGIEGDGARFEPLSEAELRKGFCTSSVAQMIRHRYPNDYKSLNDAELERRVLGKHPEYRDQICDLPAWIAAAPHQVVKYEAATTPASVVPLVLAWLGAAIVTIGIGLVTLDVYYRILIRRFAAAS
jgi:hypothetical protein